MASSEHRVRAPDLRRHHDDGGVAQQPAVRGSELVAGEDDPAVAGLLQTLLVGVRVRSVSHHHQPQVGAQPEVGVDQHVRVVLRHEPADEEDVAAGGQPEALQRVVRRGRVVRPAVVLVVQLRPVGDVDGLAAPGAVELLDGPGVGDGDVGEQGRGALGEPQVAARPRSPLGALGVQPVDVDGRRHPEEPAEAGERAVAGDEVDGGVGPVRGQVERAEQRVHGSVEVLAGHGGEVDEAHAAVRARPRGARPCAGGSTR